MFVRFALVLSTVAAFAPSLHTHSTSKLAGYLDDLTGDLYGADPNPKPEEESREATKLDKSKVDNYGVGDWNSFVDFNEFDGGDGQMGVAGDGSKGLDKEWKGAAQMATSKSMSAKNAWGTNSGYADTLREQGVETSRAQQMENWANQQEVLKARQAHRQITDGFDDVSTPDEDWRKLAKFGVERNQDFDMDETFGAVQATGGDMQGTIELTSRVNRAEIYEFDLLNNFMGFSDFRATFTPETGADWSIEPAEGSLSGRTETNFIVKYKPGNPVNSEGFLVIDTEDDKWTWKVIGSASM